NHLVPAFIEPFRLGRVAAPAQANHVIFSAFGWNSCYVVNMSKLDSFHISNLSFLQFNTVCGQQGHDG
ncbi:MAG TPA: hypothetical protein PLI12_03030, partial [Acetobacteraceae bacterium]|nr:hypothetical protein [Acetobacteraceae bacterium]